MSYRIILFIIFNSLVSISCNNQATNSDNRIRYQKVLTEYSSFLVDHFPKEITNNVFTISKTTEKVNGYLSLLLTEIDMDKIQTPSNYIAKYNADNSDLILIKREYVFRALNGDLGNFVYEDSINNNVLYYPIPYFNEFENDSNSIYSNVNISGLDSQFDIYVLDFKAGDYDKELKPIRYLPKGWESGYSKGICINKDKTTIIYWSVIW